MPVKAEPMPDRRWIPDHLRFIIISMMVQQKSTPNRFDAVIFDFDGILVDTEGAVYQAWAELFRESGADLPLNLYTKCVGSDHAIWDPKAYFEEITGTRPDWPPLLEAKNLRTRRLLEGSGLMPGARHWLDRLADLGSRPAVASSSSRAWVDGWLDILGVAEYFHSTHCREDVGALKPRPDLFLRAANALGVDPQRVLAIEDSHNGMTAALAAGMTVLVVPNEITRGQDFSAAHVLADSLDDSNALEMLARITSWVR